MRAVAALLVIPDSDKNPQLNEFVLHIRSSPELQVKNHYKNISCKLADTNTEFLLDPFRLYPERRIWTPRKCSRHFKRLEHGSKLKLCLKRNLYVLPKLQISRRNLEIVNFESLFVVPLNVRGWMERRQEGGMPFSKPTDKCALGWS